MTFYKERCFYEHLCLQLFLVLFELFFSNFVEVAVNYELEMSYFY